MQFNDTLPKQAMQDDVPERALALIERAFDPGDVVELRAIEPDGPSQSICGRLNELDEREALRNFIATHNGQRNLYFGCNPRHEALAGTTRAAQGSDVAARRIAVLDLDFKDAPQNDPDWSRTLAVLENEMSPFFIQNTGNGFQIMLDIADVKAPDVDVTSGPLAAAMARLGADNTADGPRVVRLPFTTNLPTKAKRKRGSAVATAKPLVGYENPLPRALRTNAVPLDQLCAALHGIADQLSLPGRGAGQTAGNSAHTGSGGEAKTGHPAPSAELLSLLLDKLPNQPGGAFSDRNEWVAVALAVKGAAVAGGIEAEGREAFLRWSAQFDSDTTEAERVWDTAQKPSTGWGTLMRTLDAVDQQGAGEVRAASARAAFAEQETSTHTAVSAMAFTPFQLSTSTKIPPRPFLYGSNAHVGTVSMLAAPGGTGKSALFLVISLAMASGKGLLWGIQPRRKLRALYHNAEDSELELKRRVTGSAKYHGVSDQDISDRLFLSGAENAKKLQLARPGRDGPEPVPGVVDALVKKLTELKIDVLLLDPLSRLHTLNENDNSAANVVMGVLQEIAIRAEVAILVIHHTGKIASRDMAAAGASASRGASAFTDAARHVEQIVQMTEKQAVAWGIPAGDAWRYNAVKNGKNNLAARAEDKWFRLVGVNLNNGEHLWPEGDTVQTVENWTPPARVAATPAAFVKVAAALKEKPEAGRKAPKSDDWIGYLVGGALGLDIGRKGTGADDRTAEQNHQRSAVVGMIRTWVAEGKLIGVQRKDADHKERPYYEISPDADITAGLEGLGVAETLPDADN